MTTKTPPSVLDAGRRIRVCRGYPLFEYSRAVELGSDNGAQFDVWVYSIAGAASLTVYLEGSNDLTNWTNITNSASTSSAPALVHTDASSVIPWAFVRLRYDFGASGTYCFVAAAIETFRH
jgi:hypothetical protein